MGTGFSVVLQGCGHPGKRGRAPGTYRHTTAKGKRRQTQRDPRGEAQRCASPVAPQHASRPPRNPRSEPFVEVDGLQLRVFLPDPSLDFRLQAAHGHRAAEGTRIQWMEAGHPSVASGLGNHLLPSLPHLHPMGMLSPCPSTDLWVYTAACAQGCARTCIFKPLIVQRGRIISWELESTRSPLFPSRTPCLAPRGCTQGQSAHPYLFCGKSAQHSGVANTKLQGKDTERRSWAAEQQGGSPELCRVLI